MATLLIGAFVIPSFTLNVVLSLNSRVPFQTPSQRVATRRNFVSETGPASSSLWFDIIPAANTKIIRDKNLVEEDIDGLADSIAVADSIVTDSPQTFNAWKLPEIGAWKALIPVSLNEDKGTSDPPTLRAYIYGTIDLQTSHRQKVAELWDTIRKKGSMRHLSDDDTKRILEALNVAYVATWGKKTQRSLENMINRVRGTAAVLGELRADVEVVISSILHEVFEELQDDDVYLRDQLERRFGKDALSLAAKYNKLPKFMARKAIYTEQQSETHIQMLVSEAEDYRVLYIRIADRLHTMRVLKDLVLLDDVDKVKIAQEALNVYAPLAHKMGIMKVKGELEDLSFKVLQPEMFKKSRETQIAAHKAFQDAETHIREFLATDETLKEHGATCRLDSRIKDKYQLYLKMVRKNLKSLSDVRDALGLRIIINHPVRPNESKESHEKRGEELCYHLIGKIQAMNGWQPSNNGFKDYIAGAKENGYKSLHQYMKNKSLRTNVEVQVRTRQMHVTAELGCAAHWYYKDLMYRSEVANTKAYKLAWRSSEQLDAKSPAELFGLAKRQLQANKVFVYLDDHSTVIGLRKGSTALDAAFSIHSKLGLTARAIKLQGRRAALNQPLSNGDTIIVERSPAGAVEAHISWIEHVNTPHSLSLLRKHFKENHRETTIVLGLIQLLSALNLNEARIRIRFDGAMPSCYKLCKMVALKSGIKNMGDFLLTLGSSTTAEVKMYLERIFDIPAQELSVVSHSRGKSWARSYFRPSSDEQAASTIYLRENILHPLVRVTLPELGLTNVEKEWVDVVAALTVNKISDDELASSKDSEEAPIHPFVDIVNEDNIIPSIATILANGNQRASFFV